MTFKLCLCYLDDTGVTPGEVDLADYTRSIERLNTSLGFLQTEMQRLAQQQERIMAMKEQQHQAWVIPPPAPSPHRCQIMSYTSPDVEIKPQSFSHFSFLFITADVFFHRQLRELRSSSVAGRGSVGSLSPNLSSSGSPCPVNRSPAGIKRRPASFHARTPRNPRPNDLKVMPLNRMINTPTSVDSLPRLRRFTTSQSQLSSYDYLDHDIGSKERKDSISKENTNEKDETTAKEITGTPRHPAKDTAKDKRGEKQEERREGDETQSKTDVKQARNSLGFNKKPELHQPISEAQGVSGRWVKGASQNGRDLVEIPLSGLKPTEGDAEEKNLDEDQKMFCGFFFKVSSPILHGPFKGFNSKVFTPVLFCLSISRMM